MPSSHDGPQGRPNHQLLNLLDTGVPGLNDVLGDGLPSLSFNLIAGAPGTGKTTLAMQLLFANATAERPGLFITLLGETSLKLLRYQQQFSFFNPAMLGEEIRFLNLSQEALAGDLEAVLQRVTAEVEQLQPGMVVIDSFRSLIRAHGGTAPDLQLEHFVQRLALHLTTWEVTSFLIGEYQEEEMRNPVFTIADGIFWMSQQVHGSSVARRLQVVKARGMPIMPGLHTVRISRAGVQIFPRIPEGAEFTPVTSRERLSTGIPDLDAMMDGGIPAGDSLVLAGATGTGKTSFAMKFVGAGLAIGECSIIAIFEEKPEAYLARARTFVEGIDDAVRDGKVRLIYLRPLDLSVDETLEEIRRAVRELGATRVVLDSISGFEMALAPTYREDFRESLYRLIGSLTGLGVTIFSTVEVADGQAGVQLTGYRISFLTDDIISQRYVEINGELRRVVVVVKMRGSNHSSEFRLYDVTSSGVTIGDSLRGYDGIMTGIPTLRLVNRDKISERGAHDGTRPSHAP
jgi:circadian clock protein KaiC